MADGTKTLIGVIVGLAALVAIFGIMSDCSKHVADVEANPQKACLEAGGEWSRMGDAPQAVGHCVKASR